MKITLEKAFAILNLHFDIRRKKVGKKEEKTFQQK